MTSAAPRPMVYLASGNNLKLQEAIGAIPDAEIIPMALALDELQSLDVAEVVKHKLDQAKPHAVDKAILVEDTGLFIDSWNGMPGPFIKWFVEALGADGFAQLVVAKSEVVRAVAMSAVGVVYADTTAVWTGAVSGRIVRARGVDYGWNAIFEEDASRRTFGEMTDAERLEVSMRLEPLRAAHDWLLARGALHV